MWKLILWEHLHFSWNSIGKGILWILRWFIRVLVILLCFLPFFILSLSSVALPFTLEATPPSIPRFCFSTPFERLALKHRNDRLVYP